SMCWNCSAISRRQAILAARGAIPFVLAMRFFSSMPPGHSRKASACGSASRRNTSFFSIRRPTASGRPPVPCTAAQQPESWKYQKHEPYQRRRHLMRKVLQATLVLGFAAQPAFAAELTVLTAGDQNMVDYVNEYLGPLFEEQNPGNTVRVVGTGPGDAGSQKIVERFEAQKQAGTETWDTDVAVVHEKFVGPMIEGAYLESYRDRIASGKLVTRSNADMALGSDVKGY